MGGGGGGGEIMTLDFEIHGLGDHSDLHGYEPLGPSPDSDPTLPPFPWRFLLWQMGRASVCLKVDTG